MAERERIIPPFAKQAWTLSGVLFNMVAMGMGISYPSSLLPGLRQPDSTIQIDIHSASLLASVIAVPSLGGVFLAIYLIERWGRKIGQFLMIVFGILGWLLIYLAPNYHFLLIARIICGITMNASFIIAAVAIPEYSSPKHRGMFLGLKSTLVASGGMVVHLSAHYVSWRTVALIALIPQVVAGLIVLTWPESPVWLASKKQFEKCKKEFLWLRGHGRRSVNELNELIKDHMKASRTQSNNKSLCTKTLNSLNFFVQKSVLKPMFIIFCGTILMEASGRHVFPAYAYDIIGEMTETKVQSFYFTISIDAIMLVSLIVGSYLVRVVNRRTLLFSTGVVGSLCLFTLCIYLFLISLEVVAKIPLISVSMFIVYFMLANLACIPLPITFYSELLPSHRHRGACAILGGFILSTAMHIFLQMMPYLQDGIKMYGTFLVLAIIQVLTLLILYFILPETKDKTLLEIDDAFKDKDEITDIEETDEAKCLTKIVAK